MHAAWTVSTVGGYLAFLGRIAPEKRVDRAIAIAIASRAGIPIKIAAKVDVVDQAYFQRDIRHLLEAPGVEFIGEINERSKSEFLGNARALLFPIDWPEPFGLVMIEAMACGTPVLAVGHGSVPEVTDDGISGIIVPSMEEAHARLAEVLTLDRRRVRQQFDRRFTASQMARRYLEVYAGMIDFTADALSKVIVLPSPPHIRSRQAPSDSSDDLTEPLR